MSQDYELDDTGEKPVETGFRRITYYNKNLDYHEGTSVAQGGFGVEIDATASAPPFGKVEKIKHQGKKGQPRTEAETMVAREIEVAVIGASDVYTSYWPDSDKSNVPILMPRYFKPGATGAGRGGISLFVVFRCDPERKVWELPIKTYNVDYALAALGQIDRGCRELASYFAEDAKKKGTEFHGKFMRFALWVTLYAGETIEVGKVDKGNCTKLTVKWPKAEMTPADYFKLRTSPDEYRQFKALRAELDALLATGYRQPQKQSDLPALEEAYYKRIADGAAGSNREEEDEQEIKRISAAHKEFDINKFPGCDYSFSGWAGVKGQNALPELDALIKQATRDDKYGIENFFADMNLDNLLDIPPEVKVKQVISDAVHIHDGFVPEFIVVRQK